jgi:hypothetical protein
MQSIILEENEIKDLEALEFLVDGMSRLLGCEPIKIRATYTIETASPRAHLLLETFLKGQIIELPDSEVPPVQMSAKSDWQPAEPVKKK